jgi:hypothetical protein
MIQYKYSSIALSIIILLMTFSCEKEIKDIDYIKLKYIAWNSLSPALQKTVVHNWRDAEAVKIKNPDNYEDIVLVVFHTIYDALTCPISVYVDIKTEKVICPKNIKKVLCN